MIKKFTLDYALTYLAYSQDRPDGISQERWRAMLRFVAKNYDYSFSW